jgi:hypothetical protein
MDRQPDVEIAAAVRADALRFECKPEVQVVAYSDSPASAESVSERENLPDELEPGVTYRNFAVRWRVAARLKDSDSSYDTKRAGKPSDAPVSPNPGKQPDARRPAGAVPREQL